MYLEAKLTDGELYFSPGFAAPPCLEYDEYHHYVDLNLPIESPELYGLHSNTEVTILAAESQSLLETLLFLQPKRAESQSEDTQTRESIMLEIIDDILSRVPNELPTYELLVSMKLEIFMKKINLILTIHIDRKILKRDHHLPLSSSKNANV